MSKECCEGMEMFIKPSVGNSGIVRMSFMSKGKSRKITNRLLYKESKSEKCRMLYINHCPWCGQTYNEDLRDET